MKRIVFPFLGVIMLVFSGCMKKGDNIECYQDVPIPAIVDFDFSSFQPLLITPFSRDFIAPELADKIFTEINEGDALIVYFCIDYNQQPYADYYMVYNLQYVILEKSWPYATAGGESTTDDFNYPVEGLDIIGLERDVMFFAFYHKAHQEQKFTYEMTYDRANTAEIPILYIRAKKSGENLSGNINVGYPYAFNMYSFFNEFKDSENWIRFEIHYKTGVDDDGNDIYERYSHPSMGFTMNFKVE